MSKAFSYAKRNFRDLGGWSTPSGAVKTGLLYRSAHLDELNAGEVAKLRRINIGYAVDLRHDIEKAEAASRVQALIPGLTGYDLSLSDTIGAETLPTITALLARMKTAAEARAWMSAQYADTVIRRRDEILNVLEFIMTKDRPAVFFCVAGKDRTGVVAALLLSVLGVSRSDVMRDYDLTNKRLWGLPFFRRRDRSAKAQYNLAGVENNVIDALSDACPAFLDAAFAAIDNCGGLVAYLDGLDTCLIGDFRNRLIG
jgi:protein-tyrosine phosphatase